MDLVVTEERVMSIDFEDILDQLSEIYSISKIFDEWPVEGEKEALKKGLKEG